MGHVVDEVVLDFRIAFLTEDDHDGEDERDKQYHCKDDAGNHETHTGENVRVHLREVDIDHTALGLRVVEEQHLLIGVLLAFVGIVRTAEHLTAIGG